MVKGSLFYNGKWVNRPISIFDEFNKIICEYWEIPLAKCAHCECTFRVLPIEIAPFRRYSRSVIETLSKDYIDSEKSLISIINFYRPTSLAPSNLHRWIGMLGQRAVFNQFADAIPMSSLLSETAHKQNIDLFKVWDQEIKIPEWKYKTEKRKDELEFVGRLFNSAQKLYPEESYPLTSWDAWLVNRFYVPCLVVSIQKIGTPMQLTPSPKNQIQDSKHPKNIQKGKDYGPRSPPDSVLEI